MVRSRLMTRLGMLTALTAILIVAAACAGQGAAVPTPTATPLSTSEDRSGGIEGTVTGADGGPAAGMRVTIVGGTAAFPEIAPETDEEGQYRIGTVPPGTFQVAVHDRQGQRVGLESIVVQSGQTATLGFSISGDPTIEAQPPLPPRPVMRLRYAGRVYDGAEGSYCWPASRADEGSVIGLCADKILWDRLTSAIPVDQGSTVTFEVEAEEQAQALSASIYELGSETQMKFLELGSGLETDLVVDLPEGVYNVAVFGRWPDGDLTYEFRIEVGAGLSARSKGPIGGQESCQEYLDLLVSFDEGNTEERAVVTSYQCVSSYVDSTGRDALPSASSILPVDSPLNLRLAVETQPTAVDVRLYPGAKVSGSFLKWPEELPSGIEPVDSLRPTPSLAFQYLPQQPPGGYSLVVNAEWDGPIVVFYAIGFRLQ
jgi:hypothetical protein